MNHATSFLLPSRPSRSPATASRDRPAVHDNCEGYRVEIRQPARLLVSRLSSSARATRTSEVNTRRAARRCSSGSLSNSASPAGQWLWPHLRFCCQPHGQPTARARAQSSVSANSVVEGCQLSRRRPESDQQGPSPAQADPFGRPADRSTQFLWKHRPKVARDFPAVAQRTIRVRARS